MKLMIEIPKEFEEHFATDKFEDSFKRIMADLLESGNLSGTYELETISMLREAIANGTPITELSDNIFANILLSEINKKGLAFEEVLLLLDKANVISTSCSKLKEETESELKAGDIVTTPGGIRAIIIGIEEWNNTKLASIYSEYYALPQMFPVQDLKATGVHKDVKSMLLDLLKENANEQDS